MLYHTAQAARDREDYTHPENVYKDLIYWPDHKLSDEIKEQRKGVRDFGCSINGVDMEDDELCWSCGWTVYNQMTSSYGSRIRIIHARANTGIWEIGSRWLIRDKPNDASLGSDFMTQEFLRNQPNLDIPLIKEMRKLSAPTDQIDLTLMSRAQGVGLDTIWDTLSPEQKSSYAEQLRNAIKQWRQFTSPIAKKVDGSLVEDCIIGNCRRRTAPTCKKMGRTTDEWFNSLADDLRFGLSRIHKTKDSLIIEDKYQELRKDFPKLEPYILTHGDLNLTNIIVKDDKIEAIIDWEYSGYMPWWAERWLSLMGVTDQTYEFFNLVWGENDSGMSRETFHKEIAGKVGPVIKAWNKGEFHVDHPNDDIVWLRPGFCKCMPFAGRFLWPDLGHQPEHKMREIIR